MEVGREREEERVRREGIGEGSGDAKCGMYNHVLLKT